MKKIPLTQGKFALVDDEDFEELSKYKWHAKGFRGKFYANRNQSLKEDSKRKQVRMHQSIIGKVAGKEIDHIDGDGLNNQRSNLRHCTHMENGYNMKPKSDTLTGLKGIAFDKTGSRKKRWLSRITVNGKTIHLGYFLTKEEAHRVYCDAAVEKHGGFARTI